MKTLWKVIGILIIFIFVIYCGYRLFKHITKSSTQEQPVIEMRTQPTIIVSTSVYTVMPSGKLGPILIDIKGMTLYIFKNDKQGVSNCLVGCLKAWPAYVAPSQNGNFPTNISVIKRSDGKLQYAWKGMPLYYFSEDRHSGDVNGEGIGGVWSIVKQ